MNTNERDHISFSEMQIFYQCPLRHNLLYVQGLKQEDISSIYLDYGSSIHESIDASLTKGSNIEEVFVNEWRERTDKNKEGYPDYQKKSIKDINIWEQQGLQTLKEVVSFLEEEYSDYNVYKSEEDIYEEVSNGFYFKGFIDLVLKHKEKDEYVLIDWKTTSWGWGREQRSDKVKKMQLFLYKHFWSKKHNIDKNKIKVAFVLLKRTVKLNRIERINLNSSDKYIDRALKYLEGAIFKINNGLKIKNKSNCQYCEFADTEYCE